MDREVRACRYVKTGMFKRECDEYNQLNNVRPNVDLPNWMKPK